jgi:cell division protein FtsB
MHVPPAWRRWIARVSLAIGVALAVAFVPWQLGGGDRAARLDAQLDRVRDEARVLEEDNARLSHEIHALRTDPQAIEDHARDELGMVYPGELVLQLPKVEAP